MAGYPTDLRYTRNHQWVRPDEKLVTGGVTEVAAHRLGAVGFVEFPYAGELFKADELIGRLSSETGSAALRMPFLGQINAVNQALAGAPGLINDDPYGNGWIVRFEPGRRADVDELMDAEEYAAFVAADGA